MEKMPNINVGVGETEEKKLVGHTEILEEFSEEALKDVLFLEKECFPEEWQYPDAEEYYKERLSDKKNINVFLKYGDKTVGYMLAVPFESSFDDLKQYDHNLRMDKDEDGSKIYIETGQILQEFSKFGGFEKIVMATYEEGKKRGIKKLSTHARVVNRVNNKFRKMFGEKISEIRYIDKWHYGGDEPYEYIEWYC